MKKFRRRLKENKGAANTIEMIFIILLMFMFLVTILDMGLYFNNRSVITSAAQNGARTAAIFGGVQANSISNQYGITNISSECANFGITSVVACGVYDELKASTNAVNVKVKSIVCGPDKTNKIGDRTYCRITYNYGGIPGSGLALAKFFGDNEVVMTSESEVVHH